MKFTQFLTEAKKEGANLHLEHIEDEILNRGVAGARDAIKCLLYRCGVVANSFRQFWL